jgi:hypothetical protein
MVARHLTSRAIAAVTWIWSFYVCAVLLVGIAAALLVDIVASLQQRPAVGGETPRLVLFGVVDVALICWQLLWDRQTSGAKLCCDDAPLQVASSVATVNSFFKFLLRV